MKNKILAIVAFVLASTNCFAQDSIVAEHYKTSEFDCAIFPATAFSYVTSGKHFTPTHRDIDKAEHALNTKLKKIDSILSDQGGHDPIIYEHLKKYVRQYFGYIDSQGHRILFINCVWKDKDFGEMFDRQFLRDEIMVNDGGSYFWNVKYDIDADKLFDLGVNGQG